MWPWIGPAARLWPGRDDVRALGADMDMLIRLVAVSVIRSMRRREDIRSLWSQSGDVRRIEALEARQS